MKARSADIAAHARRMKARSADIAAHARRMKARSADIAAPFPINPSFKQNTNITASTPTIFAMRFENGKRKKGQKIGECKAKP